MRRRAFPVTVAAILVALSVAALAAAADGRPGDIRFTRKPQPGEEYPPTVFPHYLHRMQYKCHVCHDAIFKMKAGTNPVTMDAIGEGKYCGKCHDGTTAFGPTFDACPRCHVQ